MKRNLIVLASLLVVVSASGCGTAENPMGPTFVRTSPGVEAAVGTVPVDEDPMVIEEGTGVQESTLDPVDAQGGSNRRKPKKDHPVHPTHPGSFDPEDSPVRH
jgi:hypothetical protein